MSITQIATKVSPEISFYRLQQSGRIKRLEDFLFTSYIFPVASSLFSEGFPLRLKLHKRMIRTHKEQKQEVDSDELIIMSETIELMKCYELEQRSRQLCISDWKTFGKWADFVWEMLSDSLLR